MQIKFGEHIHLNLPKHMPFTDDAGNTTVFETNKFAIHLVEKIEDEICKQISEMAIANGIDDVYVIDKRAVLSALKKQIPKKPINREGTTYFYCPVCEGNRLSNYCADCGQALDWGDGQ